MPNSELQIRQFHYESDTWKRNLEFIRQENAILKNRLAEVLQNIPGDKEVLHTAEQYQNEFICEDELIQLLKKDIAKLDTLLLREASRDGEAEKDIITRQKRLSEEVKNVISSFNRLKFDFNNYLGTIL
ncbi:MAG: hypothetical protein JSS80_11035 [Bacteroidetes bacterium]|nr:hypothetical protein [Bacteroidota bacterium]